MVAKGCTVISIVSISVTSSGGEVHSVQDQSNDRGFLHEQLATGAGLEVSHTNLLVMPTGVEGGEAVVNGNCPDALVVETECLNAALLNDGPQTNSSI